ncbi:hypothetical protein [Paraburkholderia sediminicola]|uniref:hypothetical protein n=1 Tax=Paraburkholderia sediminicola TaxID=458836 RepID=UPI0038B85407
MSTPNIPRVIEYLRAHPNGVYGWQIAGHLEVSDKSAHQTMLLMLLSGKAVLAAKGRTNADSAWMLHQTERSAAPPIFRAMETLGAIQEAARRQLAVIQERETA